MTNAEFYNKQMKLNVEYLQQWRVPGPHPTDTGKCHKCSSTLVVGIREDELKYTITCGDCFEDRYLSKVPFPVLQSVCAACGNKDGAKTRRVLSNDPSVSGYLEYKEMRALCASCHAVCAAAYWQAADNIIAVRNVMNPTKAEYDLYMSERRTVKELTPEMGIIGDDGYETLGAWRQRREEESRKQWENSRLASLSFRPNNVDKRTWDVYMKNRRYENGGYESLFEFQSRVLRMNTEGPKVHDFIIPLDPDDMPEPRMFTDGATDITSDGVS